MSTATNLTPSHIHPDQGHGKHDVAYHIVQGDELQYILIMWTTATWSWTPMAWPAPHANSGPIGQHVITAWWVLDLWVAAVPLPLQPVPVQGTSLQCTGKPVNLTM
jgi:hypothetical protein